jgi:hypothetical protein
VSALATVTHTRRTHVMRHRADWLEAFVAEAARRGELATRPRTLARHPGGELTISFEMWEPFVPPPRTRRVRQLLAHPVTRLIAWTLAALASLYGAGRLVWALFGDEISAGVSLVVKAAGVLLVLAALAALTRRRSCPGVTAHCPPGHHR